MATYETDTPVQGKYREATLSALNKFQKFHEEQRQSMSEIEKTIDDRSFNYFFIEGTEVMIDTSVFKKDSEFTPDNMKLEPHLNKKGIVINCHSNLHAFGRGYSYSMDIKFDDTLVKNVHAIFVIPYKE